MTRLEYHVMRVRSWNIYPTLSDDEIYITCANLEDGSWKKIETQTCNFLWYNVDCWGLRHINVFCIVIKKLLSVSYNILQNTLPYIWKTISLQYVLWQPFVCVQFMQQGWIVYWFWWTLISHLNWNGWMSVDNNFDWLKKGWT